MINKDHGKKFSKNAIWLPNFLPFEQPTISLQFKTWLENWTIRQMNSLDHLNIELFKDSDPTVL